MTPAIIITAYNRPKALQRLLDSIGKAHYPEQQIQLIISIDRSDSFEEVEALANDFQWKHGSKEVVVRSSHLGLKAHILNCGKWIAEHGSAIFLEDDLLVAPHFYPYAATFLTAYDSEARIAGVSLYRYHITENHFFPFHPGAEEAHFIQVGSSWGQAWTNTHWTAFTDWIEQELPHRDHAKDPEYLSDWGSQSWKKLFVRYLIGRDRYVVFPPQSFSTNFEEPGTHADTIGLFQVPLNLSATIPEPVALDDSEAVFDAWYEPLPRIVKSWDKELSAYDVAIDLQGTKAATRIEQPFVLTSRSVETTLRSYGRALQPLANNIRLQQSGSAISLAKTEDVIFAPANPGLAHPSHAIAPKLFGKIVQDHCPIVVLLPIPPNTQAADLERTLLSLNEQEVLPARAILIHSRAGGAKKLPLPEQLNFRITHCDTYQQKSFDMIQDAFEAFPESAVTWLQPGSTLQANAIREMQELLTTHPRVDWFFAVGDLPFVPMKYRLNRDLLQSKRQRIHPQIPIEGHVLRTGVFSSWSQLKTPQAQFLSHVFKDRALHPVLRSWVNPMDIWHFDASQDGATYRPSLTWRVLTQLLLWLENRMDSHYLHDGYGLLYSLPGVFRYDATHRNFYQSRY